MRAMPAFSLFHTRRSSFAALFWAALLITLLHPWYDIAHAVVAYILPAHHQPDKTDIAHDFMRSKPVIPERFLLASPFTMGISTSDLDSRQGLLRSIQVAAFDQFDNHKTGELYNVSILPTTASGVFQAIRLRSGSFRRRGLTLNEITMPRGCEVNPGPERVLLVYSQLVNTTLFQSLPGGFVLASPVLSVLAYDAMNLNSTQPPQQLSIVTTADPITIQFSSIAGSKCASFDESSTNVNYTALFQSACQVTHLGSFALVNNGSIPSASPIATPMAVSPQFQRSRSKTWKIIVGSVFGGLALLLLVSLLAFLIVNRQKKAKFARMEYYADQGETLQTTSIRNSRAPAAGDTRTQPMLEREYSV